MLQLMNEVEDGFRQMKEAENYLIVQQNATGDVDKTTQGEIKVGYAVSCPDLERK